MCVCVWPLLRRFTNTKQLPKCSNLFIHWNSLLNLPQSKILYHTQYKVPHKFKILSRPANRANHLISNSHIYFVDVFFFRLKRGSKIPLNITYCNLKSGNYENFWKNVILASFLLSNTYCALLKLN